MSTTSAALGLAGLLALGAIPLTAGVGNAATSRLQLAASTLGDLAPYRAIAADTLKIVDKGDLATAKARIKDLETQWDDAEATMKPKDRTTWSSVDKAIDAALTALRAPTPRLAECAATLKALLAKMDDVGKA